MVDERRRGVGGVKRGGGGGSGWEKEGELGTGAKITKAFLRTEGLTISHKYYKQHSLKQTQWCRKSVCVAAPALKYDRLNGFCSVANQWFPDSAGLLRTDLRSRLLLLGQRPTPAEASLGGGGRGSIHIHWAVPIRYKIYLSISDMSEVYLLVRIALIF